MSFYLKLYFVLYIKISQPFCGENAFEIAKIIGRRNSIKELIKKVFVNNIYLVTYYKYIAFQAALINSYRN